MEVESFVLFFRVNRQDRLVQSVQQPVSTALWVRDESDRVLFQGTAGAGVHEPLPGLVVDWAEVLVSWRIPWQSLREGISIGRAMLPCEEKGLNFLLCVMVHG